MSKIDAMVAERYPTWAHDTGQSFKSLLAIIPHYKLEYLYKSKKHAAKPFKSTIYDGDRVAGQAIESTAGLSLKIAALRAVGTPESEIESARISEAPTPTKG